jgi:hypothetical protein
MILIVQDRRAHQRNSWLADKSRGRAEEGVEGGATP